MPCFDGRDNIREVEVESGRQTSRLCAVFTVLEREGLLDKILSQCDWNEAGVSKLSTEQWWLRHKREDRERRQREFEEKQRKLARQKVLNKLSDDEKKILGVK